MGSQSKLQASLDIIRKEVETVHGATPKFYIAIGFILGALEDRKSLEAEIDARFDEIIIEDKP